MPKNVTSAGFAAAVCLSLAGITLTAPAAQAAPQKYMKLSCSGDHFTVTAQIWGSGGPTAKYSVHLVALDTRDDVFTPRVRLKSLNRDDKVTNYPWHKGSQGRHAIADWETSVQDSRGLKILWVQGYDQKNGPMCSDYGPKKK